MFFKRFLTENWSRSFGFAALWVQFTVVYNPKFTESEATKL